MWFLLLREIYPLMAQDGHYPYLILRSFIEGQVLNWEHSPQTEIFQVMKIQC